MDGRSSRYACGRRVTWLILAFGYVALSVCLSLEIDWVSGDGGFGFDTGGMLCLLCMHARSGNS